jgi:Virulence-associated protein E/Primase C terminal 2 (PriCT-2)/RepB DNA-primase from phage plasmid
MHAYWLADDLPLDEFKPLQKALAERFGSDPMVVDLPRVMRLPGTLHLKGAPQLVRLLAGERCRRYMVADIVKGLGLDRAEGAQITSGSNGIFERGAPDNVIRLRRRDSDDVLEHDSEVAAGIEWGWFDALDDDGKNEALRQMLEVCAELALGRRADWIKVLMAACASGAPKAEELAREWSRPYPGYSDAEFEKDWDSIRRSARSGEITIGSLIKAATSRGFDSSSWREKADRLRATQRAGVGPTHSSVADGDLTAWDRTAGGAIKSTYKNAMLAVTRLGVSARRDVFSDKIILSNAPGSNALAADHVGQLTDNALAILRRKVQMEFGFDCGADNLNSAIASLAEESRFNPLTDWLDGLVWDGVERLMSWLPAVAGAADTELHRSAGRLLVLAMIVRARHPGTKFDICIVLEGPQGSGKSTLARLLSIGPGDSYFGDAPGLIGLEMKARAELLSGKWLVELAELSGLARSEIENVKAFLSQTSDQFRPAYGRVAVSRPRSCVFVATTNSQTYLPDATGNRRFIPVKCGAIDISKLKQIRDQLFAEADAMLRKALDIGAKHGIRVEAGQPLPQVLAKMLALSDRLGRVAAAAAEERRSTDATEDCLPIVLDRLEKSAETLPDGRKFLASATVRDEIRHMTGRPGANGLGTLMRAHGWEATKKGRASMQVRGYAKVSESGDSAP